MSYACLPTCDDVALVSLLHGRGQVEIPGYRKMITFLKKVELFS